MGTGEDNVKYDSIKSEAGVKLTHAKRELHNHRLNCLFFLQDRNRFRLNKRRKIQNIPRIG